MDNWKHITTNEDVNEIIKQSNVFPQIIFKDSISCGISAHAKSRLTEGFDIIKDKADFNYLDLLAYRSVSNYIASHLQIMHQSPQILILKDGQVIYTVTHHAIDADTILKHL